MDAHTARDGYLMPSQHVLRIATHTDPVAVRGYTPRPSPLMRQHLLRHLSALPCHSRHSATPPGTSQNPHSPQRPRPLPNLYNLLPPPPFSLLRHPPKKQKYPPPFSLPPPPPPPQKSSPASAPVSAPPPQRSSAARPSGRRCCIGWCCPGGCMGGVAGWQGGWEGGVLGVCGVCVGGGGQHMHAYLTVHAYLPASQLPRRPSIHAKTPAPDTPPPDGCLRRLQLLRQLPLGLELSQLTLPPLQPLQVGCV